MHFPVYERIETTEVGEDKPGNQCLGKRRGPHKHHFLFFTVGGISRRGNTVVEGKNKIDSQ